MLGAGKFRIQPRRLQPITTGPSSNLLVICDIETTTIFIHILHIFWLTLVQVKELLILT